MPMAILQIGRKETSADRSRPPKPKLSEVALVPAKNANQNPSVRIPTDPKYNIEERDLLLIFLFLCPNLSTSCPIPSSTM